MIGLENGGGKSTLLGFLIHVFLPDAAQFLPRLAQRRQNKKGEEKRIEHYVPGGPPTHVVVELDLPDAQGHLHARQARVLVGACLYKDAGADASVRAEEFLWSARSVTDELTLAGLGLRAEGGRMLDHREWRDWLNRMREAHPGAEVGIYDRQKGWDNHLRHELKVDVEFVRSWLVHMNEDEGAADHVFTYASSRAFLNSLVGAVADPDLIADLKKSLTVMGVDADKMLVDRRREALLRRLVEEMGPMAGLMARLGVLDSRRGTFVHALSTARAQLEAGTTSTRDDLEHARSRRGEADVAARAAAVAYYEALGRETVSRLQLARLRLMDTEAQIESQTTAQKDADAREEEALAAALLAQRRTVHGRVREIELALAAKVHGAEPARRAAASAAKAWRARLGAEIESLGKRMEAQAVRRATAEEALGTAGRAVRAAENELSRLQEARGGLTGEIAAIDRRLDEAVRSGDLPAGEGVERAAEAAAQDAQALRETSRQAEERRLERQRDLDALAGECSVLDGRAGRAEADAQTAQAHLDVARHAAEDLTEALASSHLLDLDPIRLDDHADLIVSVLANVADEANTRQLEAAVQVAAARRAVYSLETNGLLPARPDVVTLCERASTAGLGARPGWSYLAALPRHVAERYAERHPELADGIVVNVPEDTSDVIELARSDREMLDGPIVIGAPRIFDIEGASADVTVVCPTRRSGRGRQPIASSASGSRSTRGFSAPS